MGSTYDTSTRTELLRARGYDETIVNGSGGPVATATNGHVEVAEDPQTRHGVADLAHPCVVCGAELSEQRVALRASACEGECQTEHRRHRDRGRPRNRAAPSLSREHPEPPPMPNGSPGPLSPGAGHVGELLGRLLDGATVVGVRLDVAGVEWELRRVG